MTVGLSDWATYREASEVIDLNGLFNDYWSSNNHEFTVLSQSLSPTSPRISSDGKGQPILSLETIVALSYYDSQQILPFVLLPLPIPAANDIHVGGSSSLVAP
jgi:hypothetical protein